MMPILTPATATRLSVDEAVDAIGFGRFQVGLIVACGLVQAADGLEVLLLSVLGPVLRCSWRLGEGEVALFSSTAFFGMLLGGPLWAMMAEKFGRWGTTVVSFCTVLYFGLLSAGAPTYLWILSVRGLVGIGIGGCSIIASGLHSEFIPRTARGTTKMMHFSWWSIGSIFMAGMAALMLPRINWRWIIVAASLPLFIALFCFRWLMESPRFLLLTQQPLKALEVLNQVARINKQIPITVTLTANSTYQGRIQSLFHRDFLRVTILQWIIWFGVGLTYYGCVLLTPQLPRVSRSCLRDTWKLFSSTTPPIVDACCHPLNPDAYVAVVVAAVGELPALFLNCLLLHCASRRVALCVNAVGAAVLFFGLNFCVAGYVHLLLLFFLRMFAYAVLCTSYLFTIEAYPSNLRLFGHSCCASACRVGAMLTPFVAQLILPTVSEMGALSFYAVAMVVISVCAVLLPIDSRAPAAVQQQIVKDGSLSEMDILTYDTFAGK